VPDFLLKRVHRADTGKTLVILQVFREHLETAQASRCFDNCGVPVRDTKTPMCEECSKHKIDRHLSDREPGPRSDKPNRDVWSYSSCAWTRGLHVEFLKNLDRER